MKLKLISAFLAAAVVLSMPCLASEEVHQPQHTRAKVLSVKDLSESMGPSPAMKTLVQEVTVKVTSGRFSGKQMTLEHRASGGMIASDMILRPGDRVMLYVDEYPTRAESPDGTPVFNIADYERDAPIYWLAFFFCLLLVVLGGLKGLKSLIGLLITVALVFLVLFPLAFMGLNPLLVSVAISGAVLVIVFRIIAGRTAKGYSAAIGTFFGVSIAGLLAYAVGSTVHLSGLSSEESKMLLYSMNLKIDYQGLLFGSIVIGALGAVMDVGMSIASSVEEVHKVHPNSNFKDLFNAGMNVGRDVMGTMSNTLILAYTASAMPLLMLLIANNISPDKIMNLEMIATEAVRALAGSIGLVLCIPITAFVSALMQTKNRT